MEEILKKLNSISISTNNIEDEIIDQKNDIDNIYNIIGKMKRNSIINIRLFKLKLQEEGLLTNKLEYFLDNYLKFYNN